MRGHWPEVGIIAPQGTGRVGDLVAAVMGEDVDVLPSLARQALLGVVGEVQALGDWGVEAEKAIRAWHRSGGVSRRPATTPGIGWIRGVGARTAWIGPDRPWDNRYVESFNGKLRDELLHTEVFNTPAEAKILIEPWRRHYNTIRPHSSLSDRPPEPEGHLTSRLPSPAGAPSSSSGQAAAMRH